jgi:hypothetical protein
VGLYVVRFGAGAGGGAGVLPAAAYNATLDFFSSLDLLTSRDNEVSFNVIENVVRDSCDAGAVESWGAGVRNVVHSNAVSDCDSGGVDGSWMNFLFQDAEEGGMIKSVHSVCENNAFAFAELGFLFNVQPYIEPAAAMTFARNVFAHVAPAAAPPLAVSVNAFTGGTLATSCSLMADPARAAVYNFSNASAPPLSAPVVLEWDHNLYWNCSHAAAPVGGVWDTHAVAADPGFAGAATPAWLRTAADLALPPSSPAYALPGFRRIAVERMGLGAGFGFDLGGWARRNAQTEKVQAETCAFGPRPRAPPRPRPHTHSLRAATARPARADDRQVGLWREGSYGISPGPQGWPFAPGAWALFRRVDVQGATRLRLRVQPAARGLRVGLAMGDPSNVLATFDADAWGGRAAQRGGRARVPAAQRGVRDRLVHAAIKGRVCVVFAAGGARRAPWRGAPRVCWDSFRAGEQKENFAIRPVDPLSIACAN